MSTFAAKQYKTQRSDSVGLKQPGRVPFKPIRETYPALRSQPTVDDRAGQRLLSADANRREPTSGAVVRNGVANDFNRVSIYARAPVAIQPQLKVSTPGDLYEREADRVVEEVMRIQDVEADDAVKVIRSSENPTLQRLCQECEDERRQEELQGKGAGRADEEIDGHVASELQALRGNGSSLLESARGFFEPRFGHDFSRVRIHTDSRAARLARSVNARAFTLGHDIVFGSGEYSPETREGKHLLAHELTHVVQQGRVPLRIQRLTITQHAFNKGTCGERNVQWVFSLDKPAPDDGYIVQQVDKLEFVKTCPDKAIGPPAPIHKFWEAWLVKKGDKVDWTTVRDKWTDGNTRPPRPGTNGSDIAAGTVKFFTKSTTGDLGDFGTAPADPKSPWGPGKVPNSGALPSTSSEPSWWGNAPVEGPAERGVWASWDCCDADKSKHTYTLTAKP
jgi:hypothetical protein